jgi:hypothetical protein
MTQRTAIHVPLALLGFSAGTWARSLVANIEAWVRTAADAANTMFVTLPIPPEYPYAHERTVTSIDVFYEIVTAALDTAPTAVLRRKTLAAGTIPTIATETETEVLSGDDTTGAAVGQYRHRITPATPVRLDGNEEQLQFDWTFDAAATSVVRIYAVRVNLS